LWRGERERRIKAADQTIIFAGASGVDRRSAPEHILRKEGSYGGR
jgi:hypothetical protein